MIVDTLAREMILDDLRAATREEALEKLAEHVAANAHGIDRDELLRTLEQREAQASTALGGGVAIPHARIPGLDRMVIAVARSRNGIDWKASDGRPVHLALMLAGPAEDPGGYLKALATISRLLRDGRCRVRLTSAADADDLLRVLREEADKIASTA